MHIFLSAHSKMRAFVYVCLFLYSLLESGVYSWTNVFHFTCRVPHVDLKKIRGRLRISDAEPSSDF